MAKRGNGRKLALAKIGALSEDVVARMTRGLMLTGTCESEEELESLIDDLTTEVGQRMIEAGVLDSKENFEAFKQHELARVRSKRRRKIN